MKALALLAVIVLASPAYAQSGRRVREVRTPVPEPAATEPAANPIALPDPPPVTAEKNQEYLCAEDGSLGRILGTGAPNELVVSRKEVDTQAVITAKPRPSYTREARRNGVQGFVTLKLLLSSTGRITRLRVLKG